ncbi:MAG: heme ABC exporter ATP-binding protein CcmA [Gemmatimonadetes bacterium]|nr:heme ABC exporter ATP-binding protein CcmA [Gemmatimonadota bacterium]
MWISIRMTSRLEAKGLVRRFSRLRAVDGITFDLQAGELLTIFGPNGAGKTTLLNILAGVMCPDEGQVLLDGNVVVGSERQWRKEVGLVTHQTMLYDRLTAVENLSFYSKLFSLEDSERRIRDALEDLKIKEVADQPVGSLSRGFQQRIALARALLHDPKILLLDEPYIGLDLYASRLLRDLISQLKDGERTVVLVTHNFGQGLELADRIAIQVSGQFIFTGSSDGVELTEFEEFYCRKIEEVRP